MGLGGGRCDGLSGDRRRGIRSAGLGAAAEGGEGERRQFKCSFRWRDGGFRQFKCLDAYSADSDRSIRRIPITESGHSDHQIR